MNPEDLELAKFVLGARNNQPPEGYYSVEEIANQLNLSYTQVESRLRVGMKNGNVIMIGKPEYNKRYFKFVK